MYIVYSVQPIESRSVDSSELLIIRQRRQNVKGRSQAEGAGSEITEPWRGIDPNSSPPLRAGDLVMSLVDTQPTNI